MSGRVATAVQLDAPTLVNKTRKSKAQMLSPSNCLIPNTVGLHCWGQKP